MAEYATTTLSLTPVPGAWQDVLARLGAYLREEHNPPCELPHQGELFIVDPGKHCIERRRSIDLQGPLETEPEGVEFWRSVTVETWIDVIVDQVEFAFREAKGQTWVELRFSTRVHEGIYNFDSAKRDFNGAAKAALTGMFIDFTKAMGGSGFAYRRAQEDSLFGPTSVESLKEYVEFGGDAAEKREPGLILAGLAAALVDKELFHFHDADHPFYYRQSGFYLFDILWP